MAKEKEKSSLKDNEMLALLKESVLIICRECGANVEPDGETCGICGWKLIFTAFGTLVNERFMRQNFEEGLQKTSQFLIIEESQNIEILYKFLYIVIKIYMSC